MTIETFDYPWFEEMKAKLSSTVLVNCDGWLKEVSKYGLMNEIVEFTKIYYTDRKELDNSHDEKFMRALSEAMQEWDI